LCFGKNGSANACLFGVTARNAQATTMRTGVGNGLCTSRSRMASAIVGSDPIASRTARNRRLIARMPRLVCSVLSVCAVNQCIQTSPRLHDEIDEQPNQRAPRMPQFLLVTVRRAQHYSLRGCCETLQNRASRLTLRCKLLETTEECLLTDASRFRANCIVTI